jgi:hypothetical protein
MPNPLLLAGLVVLGCLPGMRCRVGHTVLSLAVVGSASVLVAGPGTSRGCRWCWSVAQVLLQGWVAWPLAWLLLGLVWCWLLAQARLVAACVQQVCCTAKGTHAPWLGCCWAWFSVGDWFRHVSHLLVVLGCCPALL